MKRLRKRIPNRESIENNKYLRFILKRVGHKPYLWEFNRREVVMATWIGVFWAMVPMPFQMIPAVIMSVVFRANILVAIAWVWLSNPFTMLPIFYFEYYIGCNLMGIKFIDSLVSANLQDILIHWQLVLIPLLLGSLIVGVISSLILASSIWLIYRLRNIN